MRFRLPFKIRDASLHWGTRVFAKTTLVVSVLSAVMIWITKGRTVAPDKVLVGEKLTVVITNTTTAFEEAVIREMGEPIYELDPLWIAIGVIVLVVGVSISLGLLLLASIARGQKPAE